MEGAVHLSLDSCEMNPDQKVPMEECNVVWDIHPHSEQACRGNTTVA